MKQKHRIQVRTDDTHCYDLNGINLDLELTLAYQIDQAAIAEGIARAINETHPKTNMDAARAISEELGYIGIETTVLWPEQPIFEIRTRNGKAHVIKINT